VTSNRHSVMQAGTDEDAFPVHAAMTGDADVLWITEIERLYCLVFAAANLQLSELISFAQEESILSRVCDQPVTK